MRDGDRVEIPRRHRFHVAAEHLAERGDRRIGQLSTLIRRVTDGVGNRDVIVPLPIRIPAPGDPGVVADFPVHLEPEPELMIGRHRRLQKADKRPLHHRVVLQQPCCRKSVRRNQPHLLPHRLEQVDRPARILRPDEVHDIDRAIGSPTAGRLAWHQQLRQQCGAEHGLDSAHDYFPPAEDGMAVFRSFGRH